MVEILTAILSFLGGPVMSFFGGAAFRMIWGELAAWWTKKQDHAQEMARLEQQGRLDAAQHERNMTAIRLQAEMGVKVIEAQTVSAVTQDESAGWLEAVKATGRQVGIRFVDGWNAMMRPAIATWGVGMLTLQEGARLLDLGFTLSDVTTNVACGAIGIFLAARDLHKRGK